MLQKMEVLPSGMRGFGGFARLREAQSPPPSLKVRLRSSRAPLDSFQTRKRFVHLEECLGGEMAEPE